MVRRLPLLVCCVLFGALAAGCSGDDDPGSATSPAGATTVAGPAATGETADATTVPPDTATGATEVTAPSDRIGCEVEVTGATAATFTAKDDQNAFTSDYYLSQAELDIALSASSDTGTDTDSGSDDAGGGPDFTAPPRPQGAAPLTAWFLLNCQGGDITVSFYSSASSTRDDVPFGSRTYDITPATTGGDVPDEFSALVAFGTQPDVTWVVVEGGSIEIDRFDRRGAEGAFRIPMRQLSATGEVSETELLIEGRFDVTCKVGDNCER